MATENAVCFRATVSGGSAQCRPAGATGRQSPRRRPPLSPITPIYEPSSTVDPTQRPRRQRAPQRRGWAPFSRAVLELDLPSGEGRKRLARARFAVRAALDRYLRSSTSTTRKASRARQ